ncbi:MAG: MarR family winged helix-turn-helix transcriptional regulator [Acidimicrobiia bacterium]
MDQELTDGIRTLARLALVADRICADLGISLVQYRMLFVIAEQPQRAGRLADRLSVSRPTLTAAAHALVDRGLVTREPVVGDGRGVQLRLTASGAATLRRVEADLVEVLTGAASDGEVKEALCGLLPLRGSLERARERFRKADARPRLGLGPDAEPDLLVAGADPAPRRT